MTGIDDDALIAAIDRDRVVEITKALCSARQPDETEEERARVIAALLDQPGIEVEFEWVLPRRPNVIARVRGGDGPGLLLNGHIDASYHPGPWRHDPHEPWVEGSRIYGAAITDMLGALASMVAATEAAARVGPLPGDLVFLAVMHHDTIGLGAKYALTARGGWPRYGICGEPSCLEIHLANGGAIKFELRLTGRLAHISRRDEGIDALAAAIAITQALRPSEFGHEPHPRLPDLPIVLVGELHAGTAPGAVADSAIVRGDIRTVPSMTPERVRADLERLVESVCPAEVEWELDLIAVQRPFMGVDSGPLVDALSEAHQAVRGAPPELTSRLPGQAFITDAADMAAAGIDTVVYGPADWHYVPDESVEIDELVDAARVYLATAMRLR